MSYSLIFLGESQRLTPVSLVLSLPALLRNSHIYTCLHKNLHTSTYTIAHMSTTHSIHRHPQMHYVPISTHGHLFTCIHSHICLPTHIHNTVKAICSYYVDTHMNTQYTYIHTCMHTHSYHGTCSPHSHVSNIYRILSQCPHTPM